MLARGSPSLDEAADMFSAILALETDLARVRRQSHEAKEKTATLQARDRDIKHMAKTYTQTLELLGDEDAMRRASIDKHEELRKLDEVMRVVESMEEGFAGGRVSAGRSGAEVPRKSV